MNVENRVDDMINTHNNMLLGDLGFKRIPIITRIRAWYHRSNGTLNTKIIRPNDILTMDRQTFEVYRHCLINEYYGSIGVDWKKFVLIRSEKGGNLVIEWV